MAHSTWLRDIPRRFIERFRHLDRVSLANVAADADKLRYLTKEQMLCMINDWSCIQASIFWRE